jgi:hypothetical protein
MVAYVDLTENDEALVLATLDPLSAMAVTAGVETFRASLPRCTCAECRRAVEELTQVADELLMVAPVQEPPEGFESRVVQALGPERPRRRRLARWRSVAIVPP